MKRLLALLTAGLVAGALAQAPGPGIPAPAAPPPNPTSPPSTPPASEAAPAPTKPKPKAPPQKPAAKRPATFPFRGTLKAVDQDALTLILAGKERDRVIHITSQTRFTKEGKPAVLADAVPGEEVAGSARKEADGRTVAVSVRFGPAPAKTPRPERGPAAP